MNFSRLHVHNFNGDFSNPLFATYSVYTRNASVVYSGKQTISDAHKIKHTLMKTLDSQKFQNAQLCLNQPNKLLIIHIHCDNQNAEHHVLIDPVYQYHQHSSSCPLPGYYLALHQETNNVKC